MRQRRWSGLATLIVMVLVFGSAAACGDSSSDAATCEGESGQAAQQEELGGPDDPDGTGKKVGMVYDVGGVGDKGFNDSADLALTAAAENMGIDKQSLEPNADGSNRGELMRSLAEDGYEMIIGVGFAFAEDMDPIAADFPDIKFAIVDGVVEQPNVTGLVFAEEQGTFLVGAEAALKSGTGKIGFVGGVDGRADPEVRGRLRGRGQGRRSGRRGRGQVHRPRRRLHRLRRPGQGQDHRRRHVRERQRRGLPRRRQVRPRCVRGRGRRRPPRRGHRPEPVPGRQRRTAEVHPHLDAEAGRHRRVRRHRVVRQR